MKSLPISFRPTWFRGLFIIIYFFLLALLSLIPFADPIIIILIWPNYLIPWTWAASIASFAYVYLIAVLVTSLWPKRKKKSRIKAS